MNTSDEYPNDGAFFQPTDEPEEQVMERNQEQAKVQSAMPVLEDLIIHLTDRIAFYDSIDSLEASIKDRPESFQMQVLANQQTKADLVIEKTQLEGLRDTYKQMDCVVASEHQLQQSSPNSHLVSV